MLSDYRYLYVEDDEFSREIMTMIMVNGMGIHTLTIFTDSADFMSRVGALERVPDVILLDIQIKPHDGFEMLRMLRENPAYDASHIVALTASVMNEEVARLQSSGFEGAIAKPLSIQTFPRLIQQIIDGQQVWHII
jgi:CheY-like chemotaxis protein